MDRALNLTYASSLTDLCEVNSSFDTGILRIAYAGENNNGSYIGKETFDRCLKTIYNCPIVCHYDRESDAIGGHDIDVIEDDNGELRIINITTPVGCVPESANVFWETVEEDDGSVREYLCAEVLVWKRQEAYRKIKSNGITSQSMEITVKDGELKDGTYYINDFEFTAFALIGVTPCFESASLEFSNPDFKERFTQMMFELKESRSVGDSSEDDSRRHRYFEGGGEKPLNEKEDLNTGNVPTAESEKERESFSEATDKNETEDTGAEEKFSVESNFRDELKRTLESVTILHEWGECPRYFFVDYDKEAGIVYGEDSEEDWLLYGFAYTVDGDSVSIDYASKKRKKYEIVDFDEGEQEFPTARVFEMFEEKIKSYAGVREECRRASEKIASMEAELAELREFKSEAKAAAEKSAREEVVARFEDLNGIEAFEELKNVSSQYDADTLEEKCFAIRGKNIPTAKLASENKTPKLKVEKSVENREPYGGLFLKYSQTGNGNYVGG